MVDNGVLHFETNEDVEAAYLALEKIQNLDLDAYYSKYNKYTNEDVQGMSDKELDVLNEYFNKIDAEINFTEYNMLSQFEKSLNFNSLRLKNTTEFDHWLKTDGDNVENDPTLNEFILDEFAQVLFSTNHEIMIGSKIFIMIENGYLEITDGQKETMLALRNNTVNYKNYSNIIAHVDIDKNENSLKGTNSATCYRYMHTTNTVWNGSKKRYKGWVSRWLYPWGYRHAKAEVTNYKKGFLGAWYKYRAYILVKVAGNTVEYNSDCSGYQAVYNQRGGTRQHLSASQSGVNKAMKKYNYYGAGISGQMRGAGLSTNTVRHLH